MSQTKKELIMLYFERPNGTRALVKANGDAFAFRENVPAEHFIDILMRVAPPGTTLVKQRGPVMIDDRFPMRIIEFANTVEQDLVILADEVVATSLQ